MSRTSERFFKKIRIGLLDFSKFIGKGIAIAIPIWGIVFLITEHHGAAAFFAMVIPICSFSAWMMLKDVWNDSKNEVESENRVMMRTLRGKHID